MVKIGWDGIQVLENEVNQETRKQQLEIDKTLLEHLKQKR